MALEAVLVCSDAHHPYVDKKAWSLFLKVGKDLKPKYIYVIGDFMDWYSVSNHSKDPERSLNLDYELGEGRKALDQLDSLGAKFKTYIGGNHEDRLQRYLQDKAPELYGIVNIPDLLQLKGRGWKYIPYKQDCKLGKLWLTHDVGVAGRYSSYKALDVYQHSVITGHAHRLSYVVEGNATGEVKLSAQFGWLGDAKAVDYMSRQKVLKDWALGFGVGYLNPASGLVYMTPVPILTDYSCCVAGKLYT